MHLLFFVSLAATHLVADLLLVQLNRLGDCNVGIRFPLSDCHLSLAVWPKPPPSSSQPQVSFQGNVTIHSPCYINIRRDYFVQQRIL